MSQKRYNSSDTQQLPLQSYIEDLKDSFGEMHPIPTDIQPRQKTKHPNINAVLLDIYGTLLISEAGDIGLVSDNINTTSPTILYAGSEKLFYPFARIKKILTELIKAEHALIKNKYPRISSPEVDIIEVWHSLYRYLEIAECSIADLTKTALNFEIQCNKIWLMPGSKELLTYLNRNQIPTGIVSNAQFYTPLFLEYLLGAGLSEWGIQESLSSWSYKKKRGKPDLSLFDKSIDVLKKRYNIHEENILYIGNDMLNDIYTAGSKGMQTALFAGDKRSLRLREDKDLIKGIVPDFIITDLKQIISHIGEKTE